MRTTKSRAYVWDSYGRDPESLVPHLVAKIKLRGFKLGSTNTSPRMEQIGYSSELCGVYSLAWLLVVRDLGIGQARKI
jgi:hypothetical protein